MCDCQAKARATEAEGQVNQVTGGMAFSTWWPIHRHNQQELERATNMEVAAECEICFLTGGQHASFCKKFCATPPGPRESVGTSRDRPLSDAQQSLGRSVRSNADGDGPRHTKVQDAGTKGLGLFANKAFRKGDCIMRIAVKRTTKRKWVKRAVELSLPQSAGLCWFDRIVYDPLFVSVTNPPQWWMLNHSYSPNCALRLKGSFIVLTATKSVPSGEELCFNYGRPDPAWDLTM